ncbi:MAG: amino acid adenylation domain-containing protein [Aestuariibacter sp.]
MQAHSSEQVLADVSQVVVETLKLPPNRLDIDADLESFGMDSIITIELITNLSKSFAIAINPAQFTNVDTVRDLADLIHQQVAKDDNGVGNGAASAQPAVQQSMPAAASKTAGLEDLATFANGSGAITTSPAIAMQEMPRASEAQPGSTNSIPGLASQHRRRSARGRRKNRTGNTAVQALVSRIEQLFKINLQGQSFASQDELVEYLVVHYPQQLQQFYQQQRAHPDPIQRESAANFESIATGNNVAAGVMPPSQVQVAVVGLSCRFPGADNLQAFWQNLVAEKSAISEIPASRWDWKKYYSETPTPGKTVSRWAGLIDDVDCFDPDFFGLSEEDAQIIDPQERLLMQQVYHAFEDACVDVKSLEGSETGVFVGYEYAEYEQYLRQQLGPDTQFPPNSSSQMYYLANRVSHVFDFCGPSEATNTNCASSAVAINRAWQALRNGECQYAVAAGTCLHLFPDDYIAASQYGLLSGDGSSAVFDRNASGFTRGEGVGVVILKRLDQAMEANDRIYAVLRHSQQNHRGRASDISEIKHEAITKLLQDCYRKAGIDSSRVKYIELDGYATKWGDSFEYEGIKNAFTDIHQKHCALGSVKGNIGHLEPASGIASFIKVALGLYHGAIPPSRTTKELSDFIDLEASDHPLYFASQTVQLDGTENALAAVNSFADSGTNVHLLLEQYTQQNSSAETLPSTQVFVFSAKGTEALERQIADVSAWLNDNPTADCTGVAFSMQRGRSGLPDRLAVIASDLKQLNKKLQKVLKASLGQPLNMEGQGIFYGNAQELQTNPMLRMMTSELSQQHTDKAMQQQDWQTLALLWAGGVNLNWNRLWHDSQVKPVSLPLYPFARKAIWYGERTVTESLASNHVQAKSTVANTVVDPSPEPDTATKTPEGTGSWRKCWEFNFDDAAESGDESLSGSEKLQFWLSQKIAQQIDCAPKSLSETDNFIELGLSSMGIAQLLQDLNQFLGAKLAPSLLFKHYSIELLGDHLADRFATLLGNLRVKSCDAAAVAQAVAYSESQSGKETSGAQEGEQSQSTLPAPSNHEFPLSVSEKGLFIIQSLESHSSAYNVPISFTLTKPVAPKVFADAWFRLHCKFPILRTRVENREGELWHVLDREPAELVHLADKFNSEEERLAWLKQQTEVAFDLEKDALCHAHLLQDSKQKSTVLFVFHHIICDGISSVILLRNFFQLLEAELAGDHSIPEPTTVVQADLVQQEQRYLNSSESQSDIDYWQHQLAAVMPERLLHPDNLIRSREEQDALLESHTQVVALPKELHTWLKENARQNMLQPSAVLLAVFKLLLHKYSGAESIVLGMPVMGAVHASNNLAVGHFINMIPLCSRVNVDASLLDFSQGVQETMMDGLYHSALPLAKMQELRRLQDKEHVEDDEIFNVFYSHQDFAEEEQVIPQEVQKALGVEPIDEIISQQGEYDFGLEVYEKADGTDLHFKFEPRLYSRALVESLGGNFLQLLQNFKQDLKQPVTQLSMLSTQARQQVVQDFNATAADYATDICAHELFLKQAETHPERIAVQDENNQLSYGELAQRSEILAIYLQQLGVKNNDLVALLFERSVDMLVAALAVLRSGGAYVPMDSDYPDARLSHMLSDSAAGVVLTQSGFLSRLEALSAQSDVSLLALDTDWERIAGEAADKSLDALSGPSDLAYVIYTSGSTGTPKGVMIEHASLTDLCHWHNQAFAVTAEAIATQTAGAAFDACVWEIWPYLVAGAQLRIVPKDVVLDVERLAACLKKHKVSHSFVVTPVAQQLLTLPAMRKSKLKYLLTGGDKLNSFDSDGLPFKVINNYGPTEFTVVATSGELESGKRIPDIGRPVSNAQVYLLDNALQPVPVGVPGELYIAGKGLARGYLNQPELTDEKFIANPFAEGERLYKSGDLARWLGNGRLDFMGRLDTQIKIRGFRVETGEIEACLLQHKQVADAVVVLQGEGAAAQLVAFYVDAGANKKSGLNETELKDWLSRQLPDYMVPAAWQALSEIPLTANGKADRKALQQMQVDIVSDRVYEAPRNEIETQLVSIWSVLLEIPQDKLSIHDDFFLIGGHSLNATRLLAMIRSELQIEFSYTELFSQSSIARLAELATRKDKQARIVINKVARDTETLLPLSFAQERLWFLQQLEPEGYGYHIPGAVRIQGELDIDALEQAFNQVVARHESLRTVFVSEQGKPYQKILPELTIEFSRDDISSEAGDKEARLKKLCHDHATRPFDLVQGPLVRAKVVHLLKDEHVVMFTLHHIISDGWSLGVLINELAQLMAGVQLPELNIQYADYSVWQRSCLDGQVILTEQLEYWRSKLSGVSQSLEITTDYPRGNLRDYAGAQAEIVLSATLRDNLQTLAEETGSTLHMVLVAVVKVLLYRYSGQTDICVGSPIANRQHADTEALLGMFVNTLALRDQLRPDADFKHLIQQVRQTCLEAYEHQDAPFEKVVDAVQPDRNMTLNPLFQVMVVLQNTPVQDMASEFTLYPMESEVSKFDLTFEFAETSDGLECKLEYASGLYKRERIERLLGHLETLCQAIVTDSSTALNQYQYLPEAEYAQVVQDFNATAADYATDICAHELFLKQAETHPERIAVRDENNQLSYGELAQRSEILAIYLQQLGVKNNDLVALLFERSVDMLVAALAVLRSGGAYVPMDSDYPDARLSHMLSDSAAGVVLTQSGFLSRLEALSAQSDVSLLALDTDWERIVGEAADKSLDALSGPSDLAYVIYTSGSTGTPKGVMIEHASLTDLCHWHNQAFAVTAEAIATQTAGAAFDACVWEIWPYLVAGAQLRIVPKDVVLDVERLAACLKKHKVSHSFVVTPVAQQLLTLPAMRKSKLKYLLTGGDKLNSFDSDGLPFKVINNYGPTEFTVVATSGELESGKRIPDIGRPVSNAQVYLLDNALQPVPVGVPGELYIAGKGLARGYLNQPELTDEKFIANPFAEGERLYKSGDLARWLGNGRLDFMGRLDTQIKIRGFRVETGEIEACLLQHKQVADAVVVLQGEGAAAQLVAFYVDAGANKKSGLNETELKDWLSRQLPDYMVPAAWQALSEIPLTANGKADRKALQQMQVDIVSDRVYEAPRNEIETQLVSIWSVLLEIPQDKLSIHDSFFLLGGHSLLLTQLASRIREQFGINIPLQSMFAMDTVVAQADMLLAHDLYQPDAEMDLEEEYEEISL